MKSLIDMVMDANLPSEERDEWIDLYLAVAEIERRNREEFDAKVRRSMCTF